MVSRNLWYDRSDPRLFDINKHFEQIERDAKQWENAWDDWASRGYFGPPPERPSTYEQALKQREEDRVKSVNAGGLVLPGSNYIGPGNNLEKQNKFDVEPTNAVDELARKHDIEYSNAKTQQDIVNADLRAISGMFTEAFSNGSEEFFHGMIGGIGLSAKAGFESVFGPVYGVSGGAKRKDPEPRTSTEASPDQANPPASPAKRQREDIPEAEPPPTVQTTGTPTQPTNNQAMAAQGGTTGAAYGTAGDNEGPVYIGQGHTPGQTSIFTKKFMLETVGTPSVTLNQGTAFSGLSDPATGSTATPQFISTPLMNINPDMMPWYMTNVEFDNLPPYTFADSCKISVRPLGYRIPFATGQSTSENANNSATLVQVCWSTGMNHKFDGAEVSYNFDSSNPTQITGFNEATSNLKTILYDGDSSTNPAILGEHVHNNNYYVVTANLPQVTGKPMIMKAMTICNLADVRGQEVCSIEHKFNVAPLKYGTDLNYPSQRRVLGARNDFWASNYIDAGGAPGALATARNNENRSLHLERQSNIGSINYTSFIEKSHLISMNNSPKEMHVSVPLLSCGNMPLRSNQLGSNSSYLPVVVCWEVSTELKVHTLYDDAFTSLRAPFKNHMNLSVPYGFTIDNVNQMNIQNGRYYMYGCRTNIDGQSNIVTKRISAKPELWSTAIGRSLTAYFDQEMENEDNEFRSKYLK